MEHLPIGTEITIPRSRQRHFICEREIPKLKDKIVHGSLLFNGKSIKGKIISELIHHKKKSYYLVKTTNQRKGEQLTLGWDVRYITPIHSMTNLYKIY